MLTFFCLFVFVIFSALRSLHSSQMSDQLQVRKETWVPLELPDLLGDQDCQEDLALLELKVFTYTSTRHTSLTILASRYCTPHDYLTKF